MKNYFVSSVIKLLVSMVLLICGGTVCAQSIYRAKSLISQGKYVEGAKVLRPLADGGDAEAQYLAATLFLEGKGVNKNEEQAVRYATMSAEQGNLNAILMLSGIYRGRGEYVNAFTTLKNAIDSHPYMLRGKAGYELAVCYIEGIGTTKNVDRAWQIMEDNDYVGEFRSSYPEPVKQRSVQKSTTTTRTQSVNLPNEKYTKVRSKVYKPDDDEVQSVELKGDKTYVRIKYVNRRPWEYIFCQKHYIVCQGQKYYVNGSSLPFNGRKFVKPNEVVYYTNSYPRLPSNATSFDYVDNNGRTAKTIIFK